MFEDDDKDAIFLETCMNPKKQRHMCIECVPVPKETGDLAPIYFKVMGQCTVVNRIAINYRFRVIIVLQHWCTIIKHAIKEDNEHCGGRKFIIARL